MRTPRLRRPTLMIVIATVALAAVACASPRGSSTASTPSPHASPPSAPAGGPIPFPIVTPKVIGSTAPDEITALAASGDSVWIAVDGAILESSDDGAHWRQASTIAGGAASLSFTSKNDGWAATPTGLLHTTDGGSTWTPVPSAGSDVTLVRFFDAMHGWIGGKTVFERTTDGGDAWASIPLPCGWHLGGVLFSFFSGSGGWALCKGEATDGAQQKELYITADAGENWTLFSYWRWGADATPSAYPIPGGYARDIFFLDQSHGWVGADRAGVQTTGDGGRSWNVMPFDKAGDPDADGVTFVTGTHGYAFVGTPGRSFVGETTDDGATWTTMYTVPRPPATSPMYELAPIRPESLTDPWSALLPDFEVRADVAQDGKLWALAARCMDKTLPSFGKGSPANRTFRECDPTVSLLRSDDDGRSWTQYVIPGIQVDDLWLPRAENCASTMARPSSCRWRTVARRGRAWRRCSCLRRRPQRSSPGRNSPRHAGGA